MRLSRQNPRNILAGTTLQLSKAIHDGSHILLDQLAGSTVILPPALGLGTQIRICELNAATSNSHVIKVQNSTDIMIGGCSLSLASGAGAVFPTTATSDTITLNRGTTGGATRGGYFEFRDIAPGIWQIVEAYANGSGALATPFSATV